MRQTNGLSVIHTRRGGEAFWGRCQRLKGPRNDFSPHMWQWRRPQFDKFVAAEGHTWTQALEASWQRAEGAVAQCRNVGAHGKSGGFFPLTPVGDQMKRLFSRPGAPAGSSRSRPPPPRRTVRTTRIGCAPGRSSFRGCNRALKPWSG